MNTALADNADRVQTDHIHYIDNHNGTFTYLFQDTPATRDFFSKNNPEGKLGTIEMKNGKLLLTSKNSYDIALTEQYRGDTLKTDISIKSQKPYETTTNPNGKAIAMDAALATEIAREGDVEGLKFLSKNVSQFVRSNEKFAIVINKISQGDYQNAYNDLYDLGTKSMD